MNRIRPPITVMDNPRLKSSGWICQCASGGSYLLVSTAAPTMRFLNAQGEIAAFEVAPMNVDERVVAARLLPAATIQGDLVADANYDLNVLHAIGDRQLVTPRRYAKTAKGTGHRPQTRGRRRLLAGWSAPEPRDVEALLKERRAIERGFAYLTNWGGGLGPLPSWVRTLERVTRWVTAKLILTALKRPRNISTYGV